MSNINLKNAKQNKNDEFYTFYEDIENEMQYYTKHFENKTVYCNCDNPFYSNFTKYFINNFDRLKLKRLISTSYNSQSHGLFYDLDTNNPNYNDVKANIIPPLFLEGNGDFRSEECLKYLQEADIVVTNPPFSLWREYVLLLEKYKKKYIILGNINTALTKNIFPLIYYKKMWEGISLKKGSIKFYVPDHYTCSGVDNTGRKYGEVANVRWFTNVEHGHNNTGINLIKEYTPDEYPKYDNTDIINVDRTKDIPKDYYGIMGVPITYLDKHNDKQFEIVGLVGNDSKSVGVHSKVFINGKKKYKRILIKRKEG